MNEKPPESEQMQHEIEMDDRFADDQHPRVAQVQLPKSRQRARIWNVSNDSEKEFHRQISRTLFVDYFRVDNNDQYFVGK